MTVLVAYASSRGSTRGVAERIGAQLEQSGLAVDVLPADEVTDPAGYDAAVIGSAIHDGKWLPEGAELVRSAGSALDGRPVWLFSVSTLGDEESMFPEKWSRRLRAARKDPPDLQEFRGILHPLEHRNFAGRAAPTDWPLRGRTAFWALGGRYGDYRNWPAIDAWAERIAAKIDELIPDDQLRPSRRR